ncbi:hypothetical protein GE061_012941 [Apolygus lucorum]|uniref:Uncharacterized protein n=1 Tax=Apolygus lucorum TaxID=248454 RepID=A0A8S9XVX9_APOLU|nr:hypothetical protein GE061_012941 [Apolygus lucorum]
MVTEVETLIELGSGADGGAGPADGGRTAGGSRAREALNDSRTESLGDAPAQPQPPHRRLLVKASSPQRPVSSVETTVSPRRSGTLQSLGDDIGILDAILGNIFQPSVSTVEENASEELSEAPQPSAPPMEADWEAAGPSGCAPKPAPKKLTTARTRRTSSPSTSSTCSSTLSLRQLDLVMDNGEPASPVFLARGAARATVIGGLPFSRRTCRCVGEPLAEVSCPDDDDASFVRVTSSFRRPRSADTGSRSVRARATDDVIEVPSLDTTPQHLG